MAPRKKKDPPEFNQAAADRVDKFFTKYLRHSRGKFAGTPFKLEDWQRNNIVAPLYGTLRPDGTRWYTEAMIGLPRKQGKSGLSAGLALYGLLADGELGAEVYSVAPSREQARLVFRNAADMCRANPLLRATTRVYKDVIEVPETGSIYRVLASDWTGGRLQGFWASTVIIDELHVHETPAVYEAMRTSVAGRKQPLVINISTAGAHARGVCWDVYKRGKAGTDPRLFQYWLEPPEGAEVADRSWWKQVNPASWVTMGFLEDQFNSLPSAVFARLHGNMWEAGGNGSRWLPQEWWDNCKGSVTINPELPSVIAVDAAPRRDTTAVSLVQRDADGVNHTQTFIMGSDDQMEYLDFTVVEDLIRELCSTYMVTRVAFDPYNMVRSQQVLAAEGIPTEVFPQNDARMVPASQLLYDLIREGKVRHDGDEQLAQQIGNVGVFETARGWRIHKKKSRDKVDGVVALAMAVQLAQWEDELGGGPRVMVV